MNDRSSNNSRGHRLRGLLASLPWKRLSDGLVHGAISAIAAVLAYAPAHMLGLREGYWGAMTAVTIVQADFGKVRALAIDQFVGAAIGGIMAIIVLLIWGQNALGYAAAVILSILVCWLLNIQSACRVAGTTATVLLLIPHKGSPEEMLVSRIGEVYWGVLVAAAVLWVAGHLWTDTTKATRF